MEKVRIEVKYILVTMCDGGMNINDTIYSSIEEVIGLIERINPDAECIGTNWEGKQVNWYDKVKNVYLRIVEMSERVVS